MAWRRRVERRATNSEILFNENNSTTRLTQQLQVLIHHRVQPRPASAKELSLPCLLRLSRSFPLLRHIPVRLIELWSSIPSRWRSAHDLPEGEANALAEFPFHLGYGMQPVVLTAAAHDQKAAVPHVCPGEAVYPCGLSTLC